jgi:peptidoglycan/LPS O-acetylase OafA/YrhL
MGLLRLFLAIVVVISHLQVFVLGPAFSDGYYPWLLGGLHGGLAVMCFYMVSGFLISYALSTRYHTPGMLKSFFRSRFLRIFPLYWMLLGVYLLFDLYGARTQMLTQWAHGDWLDLCTGVFLLGGDWRVALGGLPALHWQALPSGLLVAWSLGAELTFYCLAPLLPRSLRGAALAFAIAFAVRLTLVSQFGFSPTWTYLFAPSTFVFFLLGHLARLLYQHHTHRLGGWHWLVLVCGLAALQTTGEPTDSLSHYCFYACLALGIPFLFERTKDLRWCNRLGDLSYPLYMTHPLALNLLFGLQVWAVGPLGLDTPGAWLMGALADLSKPLSGTVAAILFTCAALVVAWVCHVAAERWVKAGIGGRVRDAVR